MGVVDTDNLVPSFYRKYERYCGIGTGQPAWSFEALIVAEADEIAQMHHDLEDAIRMKAVTKEKIINILKKLYDLMDITDQNTIKNLEKEEWISRERLISKTSKIIVNTLVTTLLTASCDNLYELLKKYATQELEENASEEEQMKVYNQASTQILNKCYKDPEIANAISYDTYGTTKNTDIIREFQDTISRAVINTYDVQRSDSKGKYIIKNLFEAYNTNPQQLPDSALKNLYKILKEDGFNFIQDNNKDPFTIENDELRYIIDEAISVIRGNNPNREIDKCRDILIMRIICDYIAGMTDNFAISEYKKLYG